MRFPRLWSNLTLLTGVAIIVAPVAISQPINPYVLTAAKIAAALGYTPANGANYLPLAGGTMVGDLKFTDATYDIGKSGATRPRNIFASGNGTFGNSIVGSNYQANSVGFFEWNTRSVITSPANGSVLLQNAAQTDFSLLQFGGTTSSFPAFKRSGTTLAARLADDSGDANVSTATINASGPVNTQDGRFTESSGQVIDMRSGTAIKFFASDGITPTQIVSQTVLGVTLTVSTLPTASANQGTLAFVSDATLTAITGLGLTVTGGGSNKVPVYSDGTNWIIL